MIEPVPYLPARRTNRDDSRATLACEDVPLAEMLRDPDRIEDQVEACIEWGLRAYGKRAWCIAS